MVKVLFPGLVLKTVVSRSRADPKNLRFAGWCITRREGLLWLWFYFHLVLNQSRGDWSTSQVVFISIPFLGLAVDTFLSEFCFFLRSKAATSSEEIFPLQSLWPSKPLLWSKWVLVRNVFFQLTFYFCLYVFEKALHLRQLVFIWQ